MPSAAMMRPCVSGGYFLGGQGFAGIGMDARKLAEVAAPVGLKIDFVQPLQCAVRGADSGQQGGILPDADRGGGMVIGAARYPIGQGGMATQIGAGVEKAV